MLDSEHARCAVGEVAVPYRTDHRALTQSRCRSPIPSATSDLRPCGFATGVGSSTSSALGAPGNRPRTRSCCPTMSTAVASVIGAADAPPGLTCGCHAFLGRAMNSYRIYRQLRFRRTWLTVVSATTETLNRICNHPAVNAGTPLKVRVTGLPTIEHVERHMAAVMNGTMSLDDIFHKVLLPRRT
jgi:hypothetical protein